LLLDGNTEIVYGTRPDEGAAIKLLKGSAIVISSLTREGRVLTSLATSSAQIEIAEAGVYRLGIRSAREAELLVYEGRATIQGQLMKPNQRASMSGTGLEIGDIRKMDIDPFELWSRKRSQMLLLSLRMAPMMQRTEKYNKHRGAMVPPSTRRVRWSGLWYLVPETDTFTFVPASADRTSPYALKYEFWFRTE